MGSLLLSLKLLRPCISYQFVTFQLQIHLISSSVERQHIPLFLLCQPGQLPFFATGGCSSEERCFLSELRVLLSQVPKSLASPASGSHSEDLVWFLP